MTTSERERCRVWHPVDGCQCGGRWHAGGWATLEEALEAFRVSVHQALAAGLKPGEPLPAEYDVLLFWLIEGLPDRLAPKGLFNHFTLAPDGRGNHRFVFVDKFGVEHPFSTRAALRGTRVVLQEPPDAENPFERLRS